MAPVTPTNAPAATAAATRNAPITDQRCAQCGWPFGPELMRGYVMGRISTLCRNPFACYGRQIDIEEEISRRISSR